jgi:hypothetical protein
MAATKKKRLHIHSLTDICCIFFVVFVQLKNVSDWPRNPKKGCTQKKQDADVQCVYIAYSPADRKYIGKRYVAHVGVEEP